MDRHPQFKTALGDFKRRLFKQINREMIDYGTKKSKKIAEEFVKIAKMNLEEATPAPESEHFISEIASRIKIKKRFRKASKKGKKINQHLVAYTINIPIDKQGLVMYLEYGTGIKGLRDQHEEARKKTFSGVPIKQKVRWEYAVNRHKYRTVMLKNRYNQRVKVTQPCYFVKDNHLGFVFKKRKDSYIDADDIQFHNVLEAKASWVKGYPRNGKQVKAYVRYHKDLRTYTTKNTYVFSQGLTPVRFIYNAKKEIMHLLSIGYFNKKES